MDNPAAIWVHEVSEFCESFHCLPSDALQQPYKLMRRILKYRTHKARFQEMKREQEQRKRKSGTVVGQSRAGKRPRKATTRARGIR